MLSAHVRASFFDGPTQRKDFTKNVVFDGNKIHLLIPPNINVDTASLYFEFDMNGQRTLDIIKLNQNISLKSIVTCELRVNIITFYCDLIKLSNIKPVLSPRDQWHADALLLLELKKCPNNSAECFRKSIIHNQAIMKSTINQWTYLLEYSQHSPDMHLILLEHMEMVNRKFVEIMQNDVALFKDDIDSL